jgi:hypothetical protein
MVTMLFGKPAKLQDGRYFLKVTQDDGTRVLHQVNGVTFVSFEGTQANIKTDSTLFSEIDELILSQAKGSKVEWFGKEISDETVSSAYQKSVNPESELSATFCTVKGEVVTMFYDTQKNTLSGVDPGVPVDVLLELSGLVFTKRAFEPVWKVVQVRVKATPKPKFPREYLFKDDPVEEEEPDIDL